MEIIILLMILALGLVGLLLFKAGISEILTIKRVQPELKVANGVVLKVEKKSSNESISRRSRTMRRSVQIYPVIEFTREDGTKTQFRSEIGEIREEGSPGGSYSAGQSVEVLYHPSNAVKPRLNSFSGLYTVGLALSVGGLVFVGASLTMVVVFGDKLLS
jgi:hypothetical protein